MQVRFNTAEARPLIAPKQHQANNDLALVFEGDEVETMKFVFDRASRVVNTGFVNVILGKLGFSKARAYEQLYVKTVEAIDYSSDLEGETVQPPRLILRGQSAFDGYNALGVYYRNTTSLMNTTDFPEAKIYNEIFDQLYPNAQRSPKEYAASLPAPRPEFMASLQADQAPVTLTK